MGQERILCLEQSRLQDLGSRPLFIVSAGGAPGATLCSYYYRDLGFYMDEIRLSDSCAKDGGARSAQRDVQNLT